VQIQQPRLEHLQVFHDSSGKTFQECSNSITREKFALELSQQIFKIVKRYGPPPPIPNQVHILWFNDDPKEIEPYKDALIAKGYSVTNVTTVTKANFHLDRHLYNLLILDVRISTWTDQEEEEYPPHLTDQGRALGLHFYIENKDKLENKGTQVLVITKAEETQDGFIQAGLPKEQFCTAFSVRLIDKFMEKVSETLLRSQWFRERSQWFREKAEEALLQLSSNEEKEVGAALLNLQTLALPESLYSKICDRLQELNQHDNLRIRELAISTLNFINQSK